MQENTTATGLIQKSVDAKKMQAVFVVLEPDTVDLHGDIYSAEEIQKACHNFNRFCGAANLCHSLPTESFDFAESYTTLAEMQIDDEVIKKGSWLVCLQFFEKSIWNLVESGEMSGVSVGCIAKIEELT